MSIVRLSKFNEISPLNVHTTCNRVTVVFANRSSWACNAAAVAPEIDASYVPDPLVTLLPPDKSRLVSVDRSISALSLIVIEDRPSKKQDSKS